MIQHYLNSRTKVVLLFLLVVCSQSELSAQFPSEITKTIQNANADNFSQYFNSKIELVLAEKSGVFSKEQAELIIDNFFSSHPPKKFNIIHEGIRQSSSFAIGKYYTEKGIYRFYFLTKHTDNKTYIHQLRIEKEDD